MQWAQATKTVVLQEQKPRGAEADAASGAPHEVSGPEAFAVV